MTKPRASAPKGLLIVLEGLDGVGKTTQARLLAETLRERGREVVLTREPTDGPYGREIRRLREEGRQGISPAEELALFDQDRRQHVAEVIEPALKRGAVVITDRYYFSSMAYQGGLGLDPEAIRRQAETYAPRPDLVIILTLPFAEMLARLRRRPSRQDIYEQEEALRRAGRIYDSLSGPTIHRLATELPIPAVHEAILALMAERLRERRDAGGEA